MYRWVHWLLSVFAKVVFFYQIYVNCSAAGLGHMAQLGSESILCCVCGLLCAPVWVLRE